MMKKMKNKSKSPAISKTRDPTRCSPYKQNSSNISMYQRSFDSSTKKPSTNRNTALYTKGRKCLINTTFSNENKEKILNKNSVHSSGKKPDKLKDGKNKNFTNMCTKTKKSKREKFNM